MQKVPNSKGLDNVVDNVCWILACQVLLCEICLLLYAIYQELEDEAFRNFVTFVSK